MLLCFLFSFLVSIIYFRLVVAGRRSQQQSLLYLLVCFVLPSLSQQHLLLEGSNGARNLRQQPQGLLIHQGQLLLGFPLGAGCR